MRTLFPVLLLLLFLFSRTSAAEKRPPNILFIFSDDHATQAISAYGEKRRLVENPFILVNNKTDQPARR